MVILSTVKVEENAQCKVYEETTTENRTGQSCILHIRANEQQGGLPERAPENPVCSKPGISRKEPLQNLDHEPLVTLNSSCNGSCS